MSYDNNNRGAIWQNKEKKTPTQPDFKGQAIIEGVEYWVNAWKRKEGDNPKAPALSFSVTAKQSVVEKGVEGVHQAMEDTLDDDIPF